jgi:signal transduction histidine kinase
MEFKFLVRNFFATRETGKSHILQHTPIKDFVASKGAWVTCLGLIALLSICLAGLVWVLRTPDEALPTFRKQFDSMRAIEAHWDKEILSLQLGIAPNYDSVTLAAQDLKIGLARLQASLGREKTFAPLQPNFQAYVDAVAHKDWLAEQVKASYAMLRNAVSVLPDAISDTFGQPDVLNPVGSTHQSISQLITEVVTGMASFTTSPTSLSRNVVQNRIDAARAAVLPLTPQLRASVERFLVQSEVAIRERQRGNELMLALTAVPTNAVAGKVQAELQSFDATRAARYMAFWYLTASLCGLLVMTFVTFVFVLRFRFAKLTRDNHMLHQVNVDVEEKLLQSAKLSALGQMVAGITHEINTPLAYVKAVFELIKERILAEHGLEAPDRDDELVQERREEMHILLEDGLHGLEEMTTLVRTMKNFSRMDRGQLESFSIEEGIESALLIARQQLKYVADVKREFDSVPEIVGSSSQLRQVLLNLIVNAADAMSETGRRGVLTLRTRSTSSDTVEIDVCDNGPGISEEQLGKIFDPFYTTKAVGKGSGMGLSICYRIVENHGGTITVNSKLGKGSIFTVTLPRQGEHHMAVEDRPFPSEDVRAPAQVA